MATFQQRELTGTFDDEDPEGYDDIDGLLGASVLSVAWPDKGATVTGRILDMQKGIQRDPNGVVRTFDDGTPRPQIIITLQTKLHEDDDDDGRRRLFVKGQMTKAFREAMKANKVKGPRVGGTLTVTYTEDGKQEIPGLNPPKVFTVKYKAP